MSSVSEDRAVLHAGKASLRAEALARRDAIPLPVRHAKDALVAGRLRGLREYAASSTRLFYLAFRSEVATLALIEESLAEALRVIVPRCMPEGPTLSLHPILSITDLAPGYMGIPEPTTAETVPTDIIEVAIIPGVAFSPTGGRVGYGKGYYDRLLGEMKGRIPIIGLAFEEQIFPEVPAGEHDISVDMIVTDRRVISCHG